MNALLRRIALPMLGLVAALAVAGPANADTSQGQAPQPGDGQQTHDQGGERPRLDEERRAAGPDLDQDRHRLGLRDLLAGQRLAFRASRS